MGFYNNTKNYMMMIVYETKLKIYLDVEINLNATTAVLNNPIVFGICPKLYSILVSLYTATTVFFCVCRAIYII